MNSTKFTDKLLSLYGMSSTPHLLTIVGGGIAAAVFLKTIFSQKKVGIDDVEKKPLPVAPSGSKFIKLPNSRVTLRYIDDANDDPNSNSEQVTFVLLHGFAGVVETWEFLTPYFLDTKRKTRVVALDLVGSGFSDKPDGDDFDYACRSHGRVVSEFISVLGLSNVVVVGHSSGSLAAASTALQSTKNVIGAVFVANALFRPKSTFFSKPWLKPLFRWMVKKMMADRKKSLERMHSPALADRILTESFVEKFAAPTRLPKFNDALIEGIMVKEEPYENLVDELLSIALPLLFVFGKDDTYKPIPDDQKEWIRLKLDAMDAKTREGQRVDIIELEECHHYAQHEQPEALAKQIFTFVEKNTTL